MKLYNFFRSGSSHRLRIALNLKNLPVDYIAINLRREQHLSAEFKALNPQGLVPVLVDDDGHAMNQSPAIIEWLEERYPEPALLPADPHQRARVRAMAAIIGCDIHPINNRRILEYLRGQFHANEDAINDWCGAWITAGFDALETMLEADHERGDFCFGGRPGLVDCYLIPQVESARRFKVDVTRWPLICAVDAACMQLPAFQQAAPTHQPDAV